MRKFILLASLFFSTITYGQTLIEVCGFEEAVLSPHFTSGFGNPQFVTSPKRSGNRSLQFNPSASTMYVNLQTASSYDEIVVRFYVYFSTMPDINASLFTVNNLDGSRAGVFYKVSDGTIVGGKGHLNVNLGTGGVAVTTGQWYRIDARISTYLGGFVRVKVDGTDVTSYSHGLSSATYGSFLLGGSSNTSHTANFYIDDFAMSVTYTDYPIGDGAVYPLIPTADGTHNIAGANDYEFTLTGTDILNSTTNSYPLIDEIPMQVGTVSTLDFVNMVAPTTSSYVEYAFAAPAGVTLPSNAPRALVSIFGFGAAGTGAANWEFKIYDGVSDFLAYGASQTGGSTTTTFRRWVSNTAPSGGAWTTTTFGNYRLRFGATSSVDANPDIYFTGALVEAEFAPVVAKPRSVRYYIQ